MIIGYRCHQKDRLDVQQLMMQSVFCRWNRVFERQNNSDNSIYRTHFEQCIIKMQTLTLIRPRKCMESPVLRELLYFIII
jgi:hypothetical protein